MGINVTVTNVNKDTNMVTYNLNGETKSAEVVAPAQIKWAREGNAEVGINPEGKINFIKSLEPKPSAPRAPYQPQNEKKSDIRAISTVEALTGISPEDFVEAYNGWNARDDAKCGASTLFRRDDGKYDAFLYITTFVRKEDIA